MSMKLKRVIALIAVAVPLVVSGVAVSPADAHTRAIPTHAVAMTYQDSGTDHWFDD
jgi:hypothetical protein